METNYKFYKGEVETLFIPIKIKLYGEWQQNAKDFLNKIKYKRLR